MSLYSILPMLPNRVRRNYFGGAEIDRLQGNSANNGKYSDSKMPEEWVTSLVRAKNPGMEPVEDEGLSRCDFAGYPLLIDLIRSNPEFYLGKKWHDIHDPDLGFLVKILDSSMRLHVQAHPTTEFARKRLDSSYGKFECYYIISVRDGCEGYIWLGFQHLPARSEWRRMIEEQDLSAINSCFDKIPVKAGDLWFVPGGVPHAIGENLLLLEIMEPSDWVVPCEYEREGCAIRPQARYMGRDLDFCLEVFDYTEQSINEVQKKYRLYPKVLVNHPGSFSLERLAGQPDVPFTVNRLSLEPGTESVLKSSSFCTVIAARGNALVKSELGEASLKQGQSIFIAATADRFKIIAKEKTELCFVQPADDGLGI